MTRAGRLPGPQNPLASIAKAIIALGALTIGLFVFAVSATFLLFAVLAIAVVAMIAVAVFWARARLTGRPFGPREQFESMFADMQVQMDRSVETDDGEIIDAHLTPDGWSVDR